MSAVSRTRGTNGSGVAGPTTERAAPGTRASDICDARWRIPGMAMAEITAGTAAMAAITSRMAPRSSGASADEVM